MLKSRNVQMIQNFIDVGAHPDYVERFGMTLRQSAEVSSLRSTWIEGEGWVTRGQDEREKERQKMFLGKRGMIR